jgi:hypothetical protein
MPLRRLTPARPRLSSGFSSVEMLLALAIGGLAIGSAVVVYGTIARLAPRALNQTEVTLPASTAAAMFPNEATVTTRTPGTAPAYGTMPAAEGLRERFLSDTISSPAVYVLGRTGISTAPYRPALIPYDPSGSTPADRIQLDTSQNFRAYLVAKNLVAATDFVNARNYEPSTLSTTLAQPNWVGSSIFVTQYSTFAGQLAVGAIYETDVVKSSSPNGFYASVRRYSSHVTSTTGSGASLVYAATTSLTHAYEVFYPAYNGSGDDGAASSWPTTTDNFSPLWVAFERASRKDKLESADIERFKLAREQPFSIVWWPDPCVRNLGLHGVTNNSIPATDARRVYNHMGGRSAYMFTIPLFPAL